MAEPSPAALAILQEYDKLYSSVKPWTYEERRRKALVAALRTAAHYCDRDRRLLTLADEIEKHGQA